MTLAAIHLIALRKVGNAGPWGEKEREKKGPFWPDQVFKDGLVASLIILAPGGPLRLCSAAFFRHGRSPGCVLHPQTGVEFPFLLSSPEVFPGTSRGHRHRRDTCRRDIDPSSDSIRGPRSGASPPPAARGHGRLGRRRGGVHRPHAGRGLQQARGDGSRGRPRTPPPTAAAPAVLSASEKAGSDLFKSQGCVACHRVGRHRREHRAGSFR